MMGQRTDSIAPGYAIPCWVDDHSLFFELRGPNGPQVFTFRRHELGKALAILFAHWEVEGHGETYASRQEPSSIPDKNGITDAHRQAARDVLKRMKII